MILLAGIVALAGMLVALAQLLAALAWSRRLDAEHGGVE